MNICLPNSLTALINKNDLIRLKDWSFYPVKKRNVTYVLACKWDSILKKQKQIYLHRLILNAPKGVMVCHLNGNGLDCRRQNLSLGNHKNNGSSIRTKNKNASSAYRGVHINRGRGKKWTVMFWDSGKCVYLGRYDSEVEAAKKYDEHAKKRFGKFAHLNFN